MKMYAVVRYFNYRKEVTFTILRMFDCLKRAERYAFDCAKGEFGEEVVEGVSERWVGIDDEVIDGYTKGDGYDKFVYTVIQCPKLEE